MSEVRPPIGFNAAFDMLPPTIDAEVTDLSLYAVKSFQKTTYEGMPITECNVEATGLSAHGVRDRDFVVAEQAADGRWLFLSQRGKGADDRLHKQDYRLAAIATDITLGDGLRMPPSLMLSYQDKKQTVPLQYDQAPAGDQTIRADIRIHGSKLHGAIDQGDDAAEFTSSVMGRPVRLFRANRQQVRELKPKYQHNGAGNQVAAADGQPLLLINQASVTELLRRGGKPEDFIDASRFRYNLLVNGLPPFGEDRIRRVQFVNWFAEYTKLCDRCSIVNINQERGIYSGGVTKLLGLREGYKQVVDEDGAQQLERGTFMGIQLNPYVHPAALVRVGDPFKVQQWATDRDVTFVNPAFRDGTY